jgi:hypothetical protein
MFLTGKCNKSAGAPSLPVLFRQGWEATNLNAHCRFIPPFGGNGIEDSRTYGDTVHPDVSGAQEIT